MYMKIVKTINIITKIKMSNIKKVPTLKKKTVNSNFNF